MLRPLNRSIQRSKDMDTGLFPRYQHKISNKLCQCFDFVLGGTRHDNWKFEIDSSNQFFFLLQIQLIQGQQRLLLWLSIAQENAQFLDGARVLLSRFYSGLSAEFEKEKNSNIDKSTSGVAWASRPTPLNFWCQNVLEFLNIFFMFMYVCVL